MDRKPGKIQARGVGLTGQRGTIFIISAPSGSGKSTLAQRLLGELQGIIFSVSFTTRPPREGEVDGKDYCFVDDATFDRMVEEGELLEWVQVYDRRYGTSRAWIQQQLDRGVDVLLDIETVGARKVKAAMPEAVMVFILPPSSKELTMRLLGRGTESEQQIRMRLGHAHHELRQAISYDYLVVNDNLDQAYRKLEAVVLAARCSTARMQPQAEAILATFQASE